MKRRLLRVLLLFVPLLLASCEILKDEFWTLERSAPSIFDMDLPAFGR